MSTITTLDAITEDTEEIMNLLNQLEEANNQRRALQARVDALTLTAPLNPDYEYLVGK